MPTQARSCPRPSELSRASWACRQGEGEGGAHLGSKASEVLQVTADPVGLLDDGVDVQLGDLLHEAVFITFSVLEH